MSLVESLIDPFTGIFQAFGPIGMEPHDPDVPMWAGTVGPSGTRWEPLRIGAAGWTFDEARSACVGEAVERFQAMPSPRDGARLGTLESFGSAAIDPSDWVLFHPDQYEIEGFPFAPFGPSTETWWTRFRRYPDGDIAWVPEDMAYLYPRPGAEHGLVPMTSTGLATGRSHHNTVASGAREVIERDALMGMWLGAYPLHEWDASEVFAAFGPEKTARVNRPNLTFRFFRIEAPFSRNVTVVTVSGEDTVGWCFSAGAACRGDLAESFEKAMLEAVQGRIYVRYLTQNEETEVVRERMPASFGEHAVFYSVHPEQLAQTPFARATPETNLTRFPSENLLAISDRLGPSRPILYRLTTPSMISALDPTWHVVKVVIPGLQPMHGAHQLPFLGGPHWAGRSWDDWSTITPHPFA